MDSDEIQITGSVEPIARESPGSTHTTNQRRSHHNQTTTTSTGSTPTITIDSDSDNDVIFEGERPAQQEDIQITGARTRRVPASIPAASANIPPSARTRAGSRAGFFLSLPNEQRYIQLPYGQAIMGVLPHRMARRHSGWATAMFPLHSLPRMLARIPAMFTPHEPDAIPEAVMQEISRREEAEEDRRVDERDQVAARMRHSKEKEARIGPAQRMRYSQGIHPGNDSICVLCGVKLVEGIPANYPILKDPDEIKDLVLGQKIRAPWQCCRRITDADIALSKKVFFGKCGHVYCGRCVNNIRRAMRQSAVVKRKITRRRNKLNFDRVSISELDFDDPSICAPNRCVAEGCNKLLRGRFYFRELYV